MASKRNILILFLVLLTIVNVAALVTIGYNRFHARRPLRPMGPPEGPMDFLRQELGLSEEQARQFEAHMERFRTDTEPLHDSIATMQAELMSEMTKEEPDSRRLNQLAEEVGALEISLKKRSIRHMLEGKALMTPEQQKRFFSHFREGLNRLHPMGAHRRRPGR